MEPGQRNLSLLPHSGPIRLPPASPLVTSSWHTPGGLKSGALLQRAALGAEARPLLSFLLSRPPHPLSCPTLTPRERGAGFPSPGCPLPLFRGLGSLPCSRRRSPGSILSRRSGEGAAGGRALPTAPLARRTDGGDSAGLREGPGVPGLSDLAAALYPAPPGLRASGGAIGPDGTGRGATGWGGLGLALDAGYPHPLRSAARRERSVSPCVPAARRGRVGTARKRYPPPPSRTRWLLPRLLACRLNPLLATRRRERFFSPLHSGPLPTLVDPKGCATLLLRHHATRENLS